MIDWSVVDMKDLLKQHDDDIKDIKPIVKENERRHNVADIKMAKFETKLSGVHAVLVYIAGLLSVMFGTWLANYFGVI